MVRRSHPDPPQADPTSEYKIDIEDKRAVFREQRLSNMEINFLASLSKAKQLAPKEILFREGEPGDYMYLVVEGRIMISKNIPGAGEEALAFLERGEILGEMALIDDAPRSADAKADKDGAIVLSVRKEVLEKLLNIEKVSSARLLSTLCFLVARRLRDSHEEDRWLVHPLGRRLCAHVRRWLDPATKILTSSTGREPPDSFRPSKMSGWSRDFRVVRSALRADCGTDFRQSCRRDPRDVAKSLTAAR